MPVDKCISAFTLAEVLITLGIIGIIAAMTLPSLIGSYNKKVWATGLKKHYALLQNAINLAVVENGYNSCFIYYPPGIISYQVRNQDCGALKENLVSMLKLTKIDYKMSEMYTPRDVARAEGGESINWGCSYTNYGDRYFDSYRLNDGAVLMFSLANNRWPNIIIDVNGDKGPNRWGYDVFWMMLSNHNQYNSPNPQIMLTDEFCSLVEKGGVFPRTILRNQEVNTSRGLTY